MKDVNILLKYGIDINKCVEYFGSIETYDETILDFYNSAIERYNKLINFFKNEYFNNYIVEIHSLKSDSRYLGFTNLSNISHNMELKYNEGDIDFIKKYHEMLLNEFSIAYNICKSYLGVSNDNDVKSNEVKEVKEENILDNDLMSTNDLSSIMPSSLKVKPVSNYVSDGINNVKSVVPENIIGNDGIRINVNNEKSHPIIKPKLMKNKILIVDDSKMIVKFITRILSNDYELIVANNGQEAIDLLKDETIFKSLSSMLLDLNMPVLDGYGVLDYAKENDLFKNLPIIVESGIEDATSLDKVNSYPVVGIILKPFKEEDLRRIIEKSFTSII